MTAEGPRFGATPQNPDLLRWIGIQVLLLVLAWVIGMVVRRLLASRMTMSTASATLTGLGGLWGGLLVAGWIFSSSDMWRPAMIGVAAAVALVVVVIVSLIVAYLHPRAGLDPIAEVAKRGESESLEFKSSARWNMRAGKRDDAMETVIAKTVAAFMNSGGGTLLIGVDDDGRLIGLGPDYDPQDPGRRPIRAVDPRPVGPAPGHQRGRAAPPRLRRGLGPPGGLRTPAGVPGDDPAVHAPRVPEGPQGQG